MKEDSHSTFIGYRSWLIGRFRKEPDQVRFALSEIRAIERMLGKANWSYGEDFVSLGKFNILRSLFDDLSKTENLSKRGASPIVSKVLGIFKEVYRVTVIDFDRYDFPTLRRDDKEEEEYKKTEKEVAADRGHKVIEYRAEQRKKLATKCDSALRSYIQFLSEMYGCFSMDEVYDSIIKPLHKSSFPGSRVYRTRSKEKVETKVSFKPGDFKKGIVSLLVKTKAIFSKGDKITIRLDELRDMLDKYAISMGASPHNIYKGVSCISSLPVACPYDWREVFAEGMGIAVNGEILSLEKDVDIQFDSKNLELTVGKAQESTQRYNVPLMSGKGLMTRKMGVRLSYNRPISEIADMLREIRIISKGMFKQIEWFKNELEAQGLHIEELVRQERLHHVMNDYLFMPSFLKDIEYCLSTVGKYAEACRVEVVAE